MRHTASRSRLANATSVQWSQPAVIRSRRRQRLSRSRHFRSERVVPARRRSSERSVLEQRDSHERSHRPQAFACSVRLPHCGYVSGDTVELGGVRRVNAVLFEQSLERRETNAKLPGSSAAARGLKASVREHSARQAPTANRSRCDGQPVVGKPLSSGPCTHPGVIAHAHASILTIAEYHVRTVLCDPSVPVVPCNQRSYAARAPTNSRRPVSRMPF